MTRAKEVAIKTSSAISKLEQDAVGRVHAVESCGVVVDR